MNKDSKVTSDEIVLDLRERSIDDAICIINLLERICPTIITDLYKGKYGDCCKYVMYTEKHFVVRLRQDQIYTDALNFLLRHCKDIRVMLLVDDTLEKSHLVRQMEWFRDRYNKLEKERNDNCDSLK